MEKTAIHGVKVSSHAPVRGHPLEGRAADCFQRVSSHAPVRGHHDVVAVRSIEIVFQVMPP
mgnify:FL=1